jgi:spermidine synthase
MLQDRLRTYYGGECRVVATRRTADGAAFWFVVDVTQRSRPQRLLGSIERSGAVMEHSAMDLLEPDRLVFLYERMMLVAFALTPMPRRALLLGLGGGAMCRHLGRYLPDCALTLIERDPAVIALARRHFHIDRPIRRADAEETVGEVEGGFDVVLVDLYDPGGLALRERRFWRDCRAALGGEGCVAINWAGFRQKSEIPDEVARAAAQLPHSFFLEDRGRRPNLVQLALAGDFRLDALEARLRSFGQSHGLPAEDHNILQRCRIHARLPSAA